MTSSEYDLIIRGPSIVDGTGRPAFVADIAVLGDRIAAIGTVHGDSRYELDGKGLVAAPGFIDPHTHADAGILRHTLAANFLMQGVTTIVAGHCGESMAPVGLDCSASMVNAWEWWRDAMPDSGDHPATLALEEYADVIAEKVGFRIDWKTFGEFLSRVETVGTAINFASFVGHNTLRVAVMGGDFKREAEGKEVEAMKELATEAMESGALGVSAMADPSPGEFASLDEVVEMASVAKRYGGCFVPHTRHTQSQWPSADSTETGYGKYQGPIEDVWVGRYRGLLEAIEVARQSGVKLHIAHLSNVFRIPQPHPDYLEEAMASATLDIVADARDEGLDVSFDVVASAGCISTGVYLRDEFEEWLGEVQDNDLTQRLQSEEFRETVRKAWKDGRLKLQMIHTMADPYWMNSFTILRCKKKGYEGRVVGDIAKEYDGDALDLLIDMLIADPDTVWAQHSDERGTEAANLVFLSDELAMPCSDAEVHGRDPPKDFRNAPPPTAYGMFPHYLRLTVNERRTMTIEEAVRKGTSLVAERMQISGRGVVEEGAFADIVVFDKNAISDMGSFLEPAKPPTGIRAVFVNGSVVYHDGNFTENKPGMVLRL